MTTAETTPPYRLRKPAQFFHAPTLEDAKAIVEDSGQRDRILRMAHAAHELAQIGKHCSTLRELDAAAQLAIAVPPVAAKTSSIERLQELVGLTAALSADIGGSAADITLRTLCFELARRCQHASAELRHHRLWATGG